MLIILNAGKQVRHRKRCPSNFGLYWVSTSPIHGARRSDGKAVFLFGAPVGKCEILILCCMHGCMLAIYHHVIDDSMHRGWHGLAPQGAQALHDQLYEPFACGVKSSPVFRAFCLTYPCMMHFHPIGFFQRVSQQHTLSGNC